MRNFLLLLTGLFLSILPSWAQNYLVNPKGIQTVEDLTAGDYIIYGIPTGDKTPGYIAYKESGDNPVLIKSLDLNSGRVSDANYIWTVEKTESGTFSIALKSDPTNKYWIKDTQWNKNMQSTTEKATLIGEDNSNATASGISFHLPEPILDKDGNTTDQLAYIYCNATGETGVSRLSYWESKDGAVKFIFYPVTENADASYPFNLSDEPTSEGFAKNTYWYYIKINSKTSDSAPKYAYYEENGNNDNQINLSTTNPISYGSFWAFVQTTDGKIKIYNAATGINKTLTLSDDDGNKGAGIKKLKMLETNENNLWEKTTGKLEGYIQFKLSGSNYYINMTDNQFILYGKENATGEWSDLKFEFVPYNTVINTTKANEASVNGAVGTLSSDDYTAFSEALNKGTMEGLIEALKIKGITGKTISFDPAQYYYLRSVYQPNKYMVIQPTNGTATTLNTQNASQIWKFIGNETDGYQMTAQGLYLVSGTGVSTTANESEASKYGFVKRSEYARYGFAPKNGSAEIHFAGNNLVCYSGGNGSSWYLVPATSIDVNITAAGYATVNYPFAVQVPKGITVYTGSVDTEKAIFTLNEVKDGVIPANTPVILKGNEDTYTLTILPSDEETSEVTKTLNGTLLSKEIAETNAYILGNGTKGIGFYQMSEDDRTLGANKAYLVLSPEASAIRSIIFSDGTTTGIESAIAEGTEAEEYYDLQGRRVMNPTKGIYVTKSGKKVLINK